MNNWRATAGLVRATILAAVGVGLGILLGGPVAVVLTSPFLLWTVFALVNRPSSTPGISSVLDHGTLHEGQGTTSRLWLRSVDGVEHVTRVVGSAEHVALHPASGAIGALFDGIGPVLEVSPRRWGRRRMGDEKVGLTSSWGGFRWGPVHVGGSEVWSLPTTAPYDSRAEAPQPVGLVGANRSRRFGDGSEFGGIRGFHAGDRLRRINWRVSLRTGELHVVTTRSEEDSGVLIVVDGFADHGRSGGVDGEASSLDVTVRAAAALAEHFTRTGDRVSLRVVGGASEFVGYGAGKRHLRRLQTTLARLQPGQPRDYSFDRLKFQVTAGTVVLVLSPMLHEAVVMATATLVRRGLPVMVIDTLPPEAAPAIADEVDARTAAVAWRMRLTDREGLLARLARTGCPIVPWQGPGTLDQVLRRLARRAQAPRVAVR
jgi:uncharacterized protein (DUF58 family)